MRNRNWSGRRRGHAGFFLALKGLSKSGGSEHPEQQAGEQHPLGAWH